MKYPRLLICLLAVSSAVTIDPQDNHRATRRLAYSTQIIHDDPKYPNEPHASSSTHFKFNQPSADDAAAAAAQAQEHFNQHAYYRQPPVYTTPHHQHDYLNYSPPSAHAHHQTQSFNVGYSMRFKNDHKKKKFVLQAQPPLVKEEIITGSRKEEVSRPNQQHIGDDFVSNSLIDSKKQKISGIKSKYPHSAIVNVNVNTKQLLAAANLSPKTQKQLAYLDSTSAHFGDPKAKAKTWHNLSPTVEIYHSKELSGQDGRSFDHSRALGKSEGFDQTNAVFQTGASYFLIKPRATKLPLDTSLLRDPYLTTDKMAATSSAKTIPIHFDTSLIREMNKHIVDGNSNAEESAATNTVPIPYHHHHHQEISSPFYHRSTADTPPMQYGFKPPIADDNPLAAAQQFGGFEAPKQMFSGQNNKAQKPFDQQQRQVAYFNEPISYNKDFLASKQPQPVIENFSKDYSDYFKAVKGVSSAFEDPHKAKDYDFQKEFDKVLFSSGVQPTENGREEALVHYEGPAAVRDQYVGSTFGRYHQKNSSPSVGGAKKHNERQGRGNVKARVVREYLETDLRPPPLHLNGDRNKNAHRRAHNVKYRI